MTDDRKFSKESFTYVLGEALSKSLTFVLLPIYTSYLSVHDFAVLSIVSTVWPFVVIILGQSFSVYIVRGYFDYEDPKEFLGTVLCFSVLVGGLMASLLHYLGPPIFDQIFKEATYKPYLQYGVFFAIFRLFFSHVLSIYRARRAAKTVVTLSLALFFSNLVAVLVAIFILDAQLIGILRGQLLAYCLVAVIYALKVKNELKFRFKKGVILPGIIFVLPLIPHSLSGWLINYVSAIFVERSLGLDDFSIYSVALRLSLIVSVINNGLNQAWTPFVFANYEKQNRTYLFNISSKRILLLILLTGTALILFSKELLLLMGRPEYLAGINLMPILVLGYIFQMLYFIFVALIVYNKKTKLLPIISIVSGLVAVLLNVTLIPWLGVYGAALSQTIAFFMTALLAFSFSRQYIKFSIFESRFLMFLSFMVLVLLATFIVINDLDFVLRIILKLGILLGSAIFLIRLKLINLKNLRDMFQNG